MSMEQVKKIKIKRKKKPVNPVKPVEPKSQKSLLTDIESELSVHGAPEDHDWSDIPLFDQHSKKIDEIKALINSRLVKRLLVVEEKVRKEKAQAALLETK